MSPDPIPLARLMAMAFRSLIDELHRRLEDHGIVDVRPAFGFVLVYVRDHDATARDVAALMGMTKQATAKLLTSMEAADLLRRTEHPTDRRAYRLELTAHGLHVLELVEQIHRELEHEWSSVIGTRGLERLVADLRAVLLSTHGGELPPLRPTF